MRRLLRRLVPPAKEALVVDVGCGTGANVAALARDYECLGLDPSEEAVSFARSRFPDVKFVCGAAPEGLEPFRGRARVVLLMDVLEHIDDDREFLSRIVAAVNPGAVVFITVPAGESLWSEHDVSFGHFRRYSSESLRALWAELRVSPIICSYYNARLFPLVKLVREVTRRRGRALGRAGTDFTTPPAFVNRALYRVFAGEAGVLTALCNGGRARGYRRGVGLVAALRKDGDVAATESEAAARSWVRRRDRT